MYIYIYTRCDNYDNIDDNFIVNDNETTLSAV